MTEILKILSAGLLSLAFSGGAVASDALADADEPHGIVRTDVERGAHQIFAVDVLEIDGDLVSVSNKEALWLTPGEHTLTLRSQVDLSKTFGIKRTIGSGNSPNELTLTVEPGKVYYVGVKAVRGGKYDFQPVVWKVSES